MLYTRASQRISAGLAFLLLFTAMSTAQQQDSLVTATAAVSPARVKPGSTAMLNLTLTPAEGIHINGTPPVSFSLDSTTVVTLVAKARGEIDGQTDLLNTESPVVQKLKVSRRARPGSYRVRGTVTCYCCSDIEGWCVRSKQTVAFTLIVEH